MCTLFSFAQNEFITIWKPSNPSKPGTGTTSTQISLPVFGANYSVVWEEVGYPAHTGSVLNQTTNVVIDFGVPSNPVATNATYLVKVTATNVGLSFSPASFGDNEKIIRVTQWGTNVWSNLTGAFLNCKNLDITATDVPNLNNIITLSNMFNGCTSLVANASINNWNTSSVTDMSNLFQGTTIFNQNIGSWNTTNVTRMDGMFFNALAFNQNIGGWITSSLTNTAFMFLGAIVFDQNIGSWNMALVSDTNNMFSNAPAFNQNINNWNTGNVINMSGMFANARAFNQNIGSWNTTNVIDMSSMFFGAVAFNQNLNLWNTANVTNMAAMFANATTTVFNGNISSWNTIKVKSMQSMFSGATAFNQNIGSWNTSNVTNMNKTFNNAISFNQNIGNWDTTKVTNMDSMFYNAKAFDQNIGSWNTSRVVNMNSMFYDASAFNQNIGLWNTANVTNMQGMFFNASVFNQNISNWDTIKVTNMQFMFANAAAFNQSLGNWNLIAAPNMTNMLTNSRMSCANYDSTLIGWRNNINTPNNITFGASGIFYSSTDAQAARDILITKKSWIISGDSFSAACKASLSNENFTIENTKIYPNPAQNIVNIDVDGINKLEVEVFDINGRFLIKKQISEKNSIDISSLSKGMYILRVSSANGIGNFKITKE